MSWNLLRALAAAGAVAAILLPSTARGTLASWNDAEWTHGSPSSALGSAEPCGGAPVYGAAAAARFLGTEAAESVELGVRDEELDAAVVHGVALGVEGTDAPSVAPAEGPRELGSTPPAHTYANPLAIGALGDAAVLAVGGIRVPIGLGSAGVLGQWAQVSGAGTAAGAAGLVDDSGAITVSAEEPDDSLPESARISIGSLLPAAAAIGDVALVVGAVSASSALDGCAMLLADAWDLAPVEAERTYDIAGLDLELDSPPLGELDGLVAAAIPSIESAIAGLGGTAGPLAQAVLQSIDAVVDNPLLPLGSMTGTVTVETPDLGTALGTLLTERLSDGVVTIDLANASVEVDLARLLGTEADGLNRLQPNTRLALDDAAIEGIVARTGALLDAWIDAVVARITTAIRALAVHLDLHLGVAGSLLVVDTGFDGTIGQLLDGGTPARFRVGVRVLGSDLLGLGPLLGGLVNPLADTLAVSVAAPITTDVLARITTLDTALRAIVGPVLDDLATVLGPLPEVLSITVDVEPDQPGAPADTAFIPATARATAQYLVTALRIVLLDLVSATPGAAVRLDLATASAGPVDR